ncbi:MAG: hypothetical protein ABSF70_11730 [Terracidiphilus sp.]|jgi:hypothetical protein
MGLWIEFKHLLHLHRNKPTLERAEPPTVAGGAPPEAGSGLPSQSGNPISAPQTLTPAAQGRVLLIHGYSANWKAFLPWKEALATAGIATETISVGNYVTLNNEVTIKDLGEAFDRALRMTKFAQDNPEDGWTFDAVVHSTGMLVLRQWLTSDPYPLSDARSRIRRLKHLVGLAPATFGSPQAQKGRSWLGALVKGNRDLGPDFLNAGDMVLDGLELASEYTWDLAHKDMLGLKPLYDKGDGTPYVAVFIGNVPYSGISALANSPGCDGTVRWAGCALDTRKVTLDFRRHARLDPADQTKRVLISDWSSDRLSAPLIAVDGQNHGTIIADPKPQVVSLVRSFFGIKNEDDYNAWEERALTFGAPSKAKMDTSDEETNGAGWQQLWIHMVDDHGDGVPDYNIQIYYGNELAESDDPAKESVKLIADTYSSDSSYRCFYIHLTREMLALGTNNKKMWMELIASSGSELIEYEAYTGSENDPLRLAIDSHESAVNKPVKMDISALTEGGASLFYPYTTTLMEVFVEREPMPLGKVSNLFTFPG